MKERKEKDVIMVPLSPSLVKGNGCALCTGLTRRCMACRSVSIRTRPTQCLGGGSDGRCSFPYEKVASAVAFLKNYLCPRLSHPISNAGLFLFPF